MALDAGDQKLLDDIREYGWHLVNVLPGADESAEPCFAYTVGLQHTFGWPELLCYGLDREALSAVIRCAVDELRESRISPSEGTILHDVLNGGFTCRLTTVREHHFREHIGYALWFARHCGKDISQIQCLQMLWPDRNGHFPDEPSCRDGVKELQPLLSQ